MICRSCGTQMDDNSLFCPKCRAVTSDQTSPAPQQPPYQSSSYQQPIYQQPMYQQPIIQQNFVSDQIVSVGDWIGTFILSAIPFVGFILLLVWAFGSTTKKSKSNYAKAVLIMLIIVLILYGVVFAIFGASFFGFYNYY